VICTIKVIFCENEHGISDVTFPALGDLETQTFIDNTETVATLRKKAKAAGWTRVNGADYCPGCSCVDELNYSQD
jgi:hypothetical protein